MAEPGRVPDSRQPGYRVRWTRVVHLTLIVALIVAGVGWVTYVHTYSPLENGHSSLVGHAVSGVTNSKTGRTHFIIVGPAGTVGRMWYSIRNKGPFGVRVLGVPADAVQPVSLTVQWAPSPFSGANLEDQRHARPFPVTVASGHEIQIAVDVTKPPCPVHLIAGINAIPLRVDALGLHRTWTLHLLDENHGNVFPPIDYCEPGS